MYKVLLVDDEEIIREGIVNMIPWEKLGIKLQAPCSNAIEAVDSMIDEVPDILISDIKMPQMDGLELIEKALKLYPALQTIVLSGYDEFEFARKAIKLGVKEYLLKPCDKEELQQSLERICETLNKKRIVAKDNMCERNVRISHLMERLMELGVAEEDINRLAKKIEQTIIAENYEGVLIEALVSLVAESSKQFPDPHRQMEMIQSIYSQNTREVVRCAAGILHQIYSSKGKRRGFIEEMYKYIQEHYMEQMLSLQFVAEQIVHMNADYIGKEFARDCGMKFSKYLQQIRIDHAKKIISEDVTIPFYVVAEMVGFGDNSQYFSLVFKKICGMSPKEYRDNVILKLHG